MSFLSNFGFSSSLSSDQNQFTKAACFFRAVLGSRYFHANKDFATQIYEFRTTSEGGMRLDLDVSHPERFASPNFAYDVERKNISSGMEASIRAEFAPDFKGGELTMDASQPGKLVFALSPEYVGKLVAEYEKITGDPAEKHGFSAVTKRQSYLQIDGTMRDLPQRNGGGRRP